MHDRRNRGQVLLTALECAEQVGVSIRALRLYEQYGLISPRRTSKQWRLYGSTEIVRLNEILALKTLGLSLRDIAKLACEAKGGNAAAVPGRPFGRVS